MIDINKKYRAREGKEVRIYATDHANSTLYPVAGAIKYAAGLEPHWDVKSGEKLDV